MTFPVTFWIFLPQIINLSTFIKGVTRLVFCRHYFKIFILYNLAFFNNWLNYICIWGILGILLSSRHYITGPHPYLSSNALNSNLSAPQRTPQKSYWLYNTGQNVNFYKKIRCYFLPFSLLLLIKTKAN